MQYYQLTVPNDVAQAEPNASGISLALGPLTSSHLYREDRIVYSSGAEQMGTYEYQRWTEPPAEMISEVLLTGVAGVGALPGSVFAAQQQPIGLCVARAVVRLQRSQRKPAAGACHG